jgi:hypothetical protein
MSEELQSSYTKLFGPLDQEEGLEARSVLSPAAYRADLLELRNSLVISWTDHHARRLGSVPPQKLRSGVMPRLTALRLPPEKPTTVSDFTPCLIGLRIEALDASFASPTGEGAPLTASQIMQHEPALMKRQGSTSQETVLG